MNSLFNTQDNQEFLGIRSDASLNKANKKGTPQYEEWLRKYREKRGAKAKPEDAAKEKSEAKDTLRSKNNIPSLVEAVNFFIHSRPGSSKEIKFNGSNIKFEKLECKDEELKSPDNSTDQKYRVTIDGKEKGIINSYPAKVLSYATEGKSEEIAKESFTSIMKDIANAKISDLNKVTIFGSNKLDKEINKGIFNSVKDQIPEELESGKSFKFKLFGDSYDIKLERSKSGKTYKVLINREGNYYNTFNNISSTEDKIKVDDKIAKKLAISAMGSKLSYFPNPDSVLK